MSRLNSRNRKRLYKLLVIRDGERCKICRMKGDPATLVIDHIDNDNSNNDLENLQLLCRRHNYFKDPREAPYLSPVCVHEQEAELTRRPTPEHEKSREAQPIFRHWLYATLQKHDSMPYDEVLNSGAEIADVSQHAVRRYLARMTSQEGICQISVRYDGVKIVEFKPKHANKVFSKELLVKKANKIIDRQKEIDSKTDSSREHHTE